jgi:hypothetical protein
MLLNTSPLVHVCEQAVQCPPAPGMTAECDRWFIEAEHSGAQIVNSISTKKGISQIDAMAEMLACLMVHAWDLDDQSSTDDRQPRGSFQKALALANHRLAVVGRNTNTALQ